MGDKEACDDCKQMCSLIHGEKTDSSPLVTTFTRVLFGHCDFSEHLSLPPKVSQAIPVLVVGENYTLQDTNGQLWEVKLGTKDSVLAFRDGWNKFYEDHGLRVGYVLTFHYIRNSHFVVEIFDTTGFEKLKFPVANSELRFRVDPDGGSDSRPRPDTSAESDAAVVVLNENTVSAKVASMEPAAEVAAPTLSKNITSKRANVAEVDSDGDHPYVPPLKNQCQAPSESRIESPTKSSKNIEKAAGHDKKHSTKRLKSSTRSAQTSGGVERNNIVRRVVKTKPVGSLNDDSSNAPAFSFTAVLGCQKFVLAFPASVTLWESVSVKPVNLKGPNGIVLPVLYKNELGIKSFTTGWQNFCSSCSLREGDECVFILEDEAEATFRVNVNRK